jgi:hypothetical protein
MSPETFEQVMRLIHVLKQHAIHSNNLTLWGRADALYWRLLRTSS